MKDLINTIKEQGWNAFTKQVVREKLVNCPTGRWSYYELTKCFHNKNIIVEEVIKVLGEIRSDWKRNDEQYFSKHDYEVGEDNVLSCKRKMHRSFHTGEIIEFWNGTSLTRAEAFLTRGDGYTQLEAPVNDNGRKTRYGIQVMLEDFRALQYAERQAYPLHDRPAVIHGWIPVEYLFPANNENEYSIPWFRYDKIMNAEIIKYSAYFL